jgi:hypothetical protein
MIHMVFGCLADEALDHRGAVEVPENRERRVVILSAIAVPDQVQIEANLILFDHPGNCLRLRLRGKAR